MAVEKQCRICQKSVYIYDLCPECSSLFVSILMDGDYLTQDEIDKIEREIAEFISQGVG